MSLFSPVSTVPLLFASLCLDSLAPAGETVIPYRLPRAGNVSLAAYDSSGRLLRTLLAGEPRAAGDHTAAWDGLDQAGRAVGPGVYSWKLLMNQGLEADYLAVVGQSVIDPAQPWVWNVGSHQGPSCAEPGVGGAIYHASRNSEGPPVVMKLASENGPVLWTRGWQSKGPVDMVEAGDRLFILGWNAELQRVDAATGRDDGPPRDLLWPGDTRPGCDDAVRSYGIKISRDGENLVVAYRDHHVLRWLHPKTGATLREVAIPAPRAVAAGENGAVFALSGAELVSMSAGGEISTILGKGTLADPAAFAYDAGRKEFLVADGGSDQRVRRFSSEGKSLATHGRLGGRLDGAYQERDFRDVSHIRPDGAGGFYAVESDHLRRIVHVDAQGAVVKEWLGGSPFFSVTSVDTAAPGELWYNASYTTMAVVKLDTDSGAWRLTHTYSMPEKGFADGLFPAIGDFPVWRVRHLAGGTFLLHESPPALLRVDAAAGRLVPVALASHKRWDARAFKNAAINAALARQGLAYDDPGCDAFTWSDTNGNGAPDAEEFRFHSVAAPLHNRYCAFDAQLNIYTGFQAAANHTYTGKRWMLFDFQNSAYAKLPNVAAPGQPPVWDWTRLELSAAKLPSELLGESLGTAAARWDPSGGVTLALRGEIGGHADRHGLVWPEDTIGASFLLRATPEGLSWVVSKQKSPGMTAAALMRHPGYFPGVTHGCVIAGNRNHYGAAAWTEDGLFAGWFLDRHAADLPAWAYHPAGRGLSGLFAGDDWECAGSIADLPDGSVLWIPRSSGRATVLKVRGWDGWHRDSGKVEIKQPAPAAAGDGTGLTANYFRGADFSGLPVINRVDPRLWFVQASDNKRAPGWAGGPCPGIAAGEPFSVRWTGRLVAPFTEDHWFRVYNINQPASFLEAQWWKDGAGFAKLWINDVLVIDRAAGAQADGPFESAPVRLKAGQSYRLKVEYVSPGQAKPEFALSWASNTMAWKRVSTAYFYPDDAPATPEVSLAPEPGAVRFRLKAPLAEPLTVRWRSLGSNWRPAAGQTIVPAHETTASVAFPAEKGRQQITLEPDAAYRGDGSASSVTVGALPSVTTGLIAAYLLDEAAGSVAHDAVGSLLAPFEVFMNPPTPRWLPEGGVRGGAAEFSEPGIRLRLPVPEIMGDFTLAFWFRTRESTAPLMVGSFNLLLKDGRPQMEFGGWPVTMAPGPRLDDGAWHHLAFLWDQSDGKRAMRLLVDGAIVGTGTGPDRGGPGRLTLGESHALPGLGFTGAFDDVRLYSRCLSAEELAALGRRDGKP